MEIIRDMAEKWHSSFDLLAKITRFSFLPPFVSPSKSKFGYVTLFVLLTFVVRSFLVVITTTETEKETLYRSIFFCTLYIQVSLKALTFLLKRKLFENYFQDMNNFIKIIEKNNFYEKDLFLNIWIKNDLFLYAKWLSGGAVVCAISWVSFVFYETIANAEKLKMDILPYYSPYYENSSSVKLVYAIIDNTFLIFGLFSFLNTEIIFMAILNFLYCQYQYLKITLDKLSIDGDGRVVKWWLENHCTVIV